MLTNVKKKYIHVDTVQNVSISPVHMNVYALMVIVETHIMGVLVIKRNVSKTQIA